MYVHLSSALIVEFERTSYTVSESSFFANITIVKRGLITQTVSVSFITVDGPATGMSSSYSC